MTNHDLEPMVTLLHFTTPLWLTHRGGWENPAMIPFFEHFGKRWHEPWASRGRRSCVLYRCTDSDSALATLAGISGRALH